MKAQEQKRAMLAPVLGLALALIGLFAAAPASAATPGQLESWGSFGFGAGQFSDPVMLGVDTSDGSVFVGDLTNVNASTEDREFLRIQKLSSTGTALGSVQIARYTNPPTDTKVVALLGIAVDPVLQRFYVLESEKQNETSGEIVAKRIRVFSTVPKEGVLVAPEGGPTTLPVPTGTAFAEGLFLPKGIAVDPSNHDVVIMAENKTAPKHTLFQRVSSAGVIGARFTDSANALRPANEKATAFTVGPDGTVYSVTGGIPLEGVPPKTRAWEIPPAFTSVSKVPGFEAELESEELSYGLETQIAATLTGGPQIAISPDGSTLYWKERVALSAPTVGGNMLVRGYSLTDNATTAVYGGGAKEACRIETSAAGLATIGEKLLVFDYGRLNEAAAEKPPYGDKLYSFGPGGSGCLDPVAKFKANGVEGNVKASQGAAVSFDASPSVLTSGPSATPGFRRELIWKFGDGSEKVVKGEGGGEAPLTVSHTYSTSGNFKVTLQIRLKKPDYGNPALVEHNVEVEGGTPEFTLKVAKNGSGSGSVSSSPVGIACGAVCEKAFTEGTLVKLSGLPDPGSKAVVWQSCPGTVNGENQCEVTMSAAKEAVATFDLEQHLLTVVKNGSGSGTVTSSPAGINCGGTCQLSFDHGALVKLTGTPGANSKAVVWQTCPGTVNGSNQCEVTVDAAKEAVATFDLEQRLLTVAKNGSGSGTVTSTPAGISCGATCQFSFEYGTLVKLTGTPGANSKAVVWQTCPGTVNGSNQCEVTVDAAKEAVATFDLEQHLLKVTKNGTGTGTVVSSPAGINCGPSCETAVVHGTMVKLTGTPTADSEPVSWTGCDAVNAESQCEVTIGAAREVTATFVRKTPQLTVTTSGSGTGTVTSNPAGISCDATCQFSFEYGALVKLTGVAGGGSKAVVWTGCDAVNGSNQCEVTMTQAASVIATFTPENLNALIVSRNGSGAGTVSSAPAGISCGAECSHDYAEGTLVKLTGTPGANSKAVVWQTCPGTVNGANQCEVTMSAARNVSATFDLEQHPLTVVTSGSGTIASSPAGISCGASCQVNFDHGTLVKLTGTPTAGSKAVVWQSCPGTVNGSNQCEVTVDAAKEAVAVFSLESLNTLIVSKNGSGAGTVSSAPAGISCGAECSHDYAEGTLVKLTGTAGANSKAVVWQTCPGTVNGSNQCEVTMSAAKEAVATFDLEQHLLTVVKNGSGFGTVTSSPAGINCGSTCQINFDHGTVVKLTGTPSAGSKAVVWESCPGTVNGSNQCEVTISAAKNVSAGFEPELRLLKVSRNGTGAGTVSSSPAGINCGPTCEASFAHGTLVKLTGTPTAGSKAVAWQTCPGTVNGSNQCEVTVDAAKEAVATFDLEGSAPEPHQLTVNKSGSGAGTVTSSPAGVNCGAACEVVFAGGTLVKLTGTPGANSKAVVWQSCPGTVNGSNQCEVTISAARTVSAAFDLEEHPLTVVTDGSGSGTVSSSPVGIACGATCQLSFDHGTLVKLSGTPTTGSKAVVWQTCPGTVNGANQCEVTVDAAKEAVAGFELIPQARLSLTKAGSGAGYVASAPAGIGCGGTCGANFPIGTVVKLTGTAGANTKEVAWSGCDSVVGANRCEVTLDGATSVTATFDLIAAAAPTPEPEPQGEEPEAGKKKLTAKQKALAKCKKLKGKAKAKCVRKANRIGKSAKDKRHARSLRRHHGGLR